MALDAGLAKPRCVDEDCLGHVPAEGRRQWRAAATVTQEGSETVSAVLGAVERLSELQLGVSAIGTVGRFGKATAARVPRALNRWNEFEKLTAGVNLDRRELYCNLLQSLANQGIEPALVRLKAGDPTKIAIIGRDMVGRVRPVAINNGAETLVLTSKATRQLERLTAQYDGRIPYDVATKTLAFRENRVWVEKLRTERYTVMDIGAPPNFPPSAFYDMETQELFDLP